ncbi:MAG: class I SAM-dependent methyltransferase [Desulfonatronovibrionaceae bacterium]
MKIPEILSETSLDTLIEQAAKHFEVSFQKVRIGSLYLDILQPADMEQYIQKLADESVGEVTLPMWIKIWPAAVLLGHYISSLAPEPDDFQVLELGCGTGLAGLVAASLGLRVTLTDSSPEALLMARINILKNRLENRAEIRLLDFRQQKLNKNFHLILGSEIFHMSNSGQRLMKFLLNHLHPGPDSQALLAVDYRRRPELFLKNASREFTISEKNIGYKEQTTDHFRPEKFLCSIFRLKPRKI